MEIKANLDAVLEGRILAAVVVIFSFAYSIEAATAAYEDDSGSFSPRSSPHRHWVSLSSWRRRF